MSQHPGRAFNSPKSSRKRAGVRAHVPLFKELRFRVLGVPFRDLYTGSLTGIYTACFARSRGFMFCGFTGLGFRVQRCRGSIKAQITVF